MELLFRGLEYPMAGRSIFGANLKRLRFSLGDSTAHGMMMGEAGFRMRPLDKALRETAGKVGVKDFLLIVYSPSTSSDPSIL